MDDELHTELNKIRIELQQTADKISTRFSRVEGQLDDLGADLLNHDRFINFFNNELGIVRQRIDNLEKKISELGAKISEEEKKEEKGKKRKKED